MIAFVNSICEVHDTLSEMSSPEVADTLGTLPMRELLSLDRALQRIQGEYVNAHAKLREVEEHIAREQEKLKADVSEEMKDRIRQRIDKLKEDYDTRLESLSQLNPKLQSQLARMRQTLDKL